MQEKQKKKRGDEGYIKADSPHALTIGPDLEKKF
jgi:hypothetical protein